MTKKDSKDTKCYPLLIKAYVLNQTKPLYLLINEEVLSDYLIMSYDKPLKRLVKILSKNKCRKTLTVLLS